MKKLLSAGLVSVLSVACVAAFAGCNNSAKDMTENKAKDAAEIVRHMYEEKFDGTQSADGYEVVSQVRIAEEVYRVDWAVTSETFGNVSEYIQIGDIDETTKLITVSVTQAEEVIDYTLTATVKDGSCSEEVSFKRQVPAKSKMHAGTQADPFTLSNVIEIANAIEGNAKDNYYTDENGTPKQVYVTGYIVDCGTDQTAKGYNRVGFVWIADEYENGKDKTSADAVMVLSINYDATNLTCYGDLKKGAKITVKGYIEKYIKNSTASPQPEVTYYKGNGITCEALEKIK